MKTFLCLLASVAVIGCAPEKKEAPVMTGAYKMVSQKMTSPTAVDSTEAPAQQMKIYTPHYTMWAKVQASDSVPSFGIAEYTVGPEGATESFIYAVLDTTIYDEMTSYDLEIEKTEKGYKQVITGAAIGMKKFTFKEEYESVGHTRSTPLDGAWKLTRGYHVTGKDTIANRMVQFKIYNSGYMIFGFTFPDAERRLRTIVGYGTFEMDGDNKSEENMIVCSYPSIAGRTYDIAIEFMGPDAYRQVIAAGNGFDVEEYRRMKE